MTAVQIIIVVSWVLIFVGFFGSMAICKYMGVKVRLIDNEFIELFTNGHTKLYWTLTILGFFGGVYYSWYLYNSGFGLWAAILSYSKLMGIVVVVSWIVFWFMHRKQKDQ